MTNEQIIQKMKEDMEMRGFSEYTKGAYLNKTKHIMEYFDKPMENVTMEELRKYLLEYLRKEKNLSERSVNYYNSVIRFVYEVSMDKVINKKQLPMYRNRKRVCTVLTKEELGTFFNACKNYKYKTMFMLVYGTGLRISEVANLRVGDIDSKKMRIFVRKGKGSKERYTILPEISLQMLRKYWKTYGRKGGKEDRVFLNETGGAISTESIRTQFRKYREKSKLDDKFVVHSLRHSFATDLIERGASIIQVKELMGHSNIRSTMEYVHIAKMELGIKSPIDNFIEKEGEKGNDRITRNI